MPSLLYMNSGWVQFGYRFALDYMVFLIMLIAIGGRPFGRVAKTLIVIGIAINLFGAITFDRAGSTTGSAATPTTSSWQTDRYARPEIIQRVRKLHAELKAAARSGETRGRARQLETVMLEPQHAPHYNSLSDKLLALEVDHPKLAGSMQRLVELLSSAGL